MQEHDEAVNNEVVEDTTAAEPAAVETQSSEDSQEADYKVVIDDSGELQRVPIEKKEEEDESEDDEDEDDSNDSMDQAESGGPKKGADARKEQLASEIDQRNEEIRQLVAEKNRVLAEQQAMQEEIQALRQQSQTASLPTVDQIMEQENPATGDYYTQFEAQAIVENFALKQQLAQFEQQREAEAYNAQIAESTTSLASEAERALKEFPVFDDQSPDYDPVLAEEVDELVQGALIRDQKGQVVGTNVPIYQVYKTHFNAAKAGIRARKQKQAEAAAQASADVVGSGVRQSSKNFEDLSLSQMEARLKRRGLVQ